MITIFTISFLLGATMKVADLLDEHGLILFKRADLFFGITWGILGALLIRFDYLTANMYVALFVSYIFRGKIDYLNHGIGSTIIIFTFIYLLHNRRLNIEWPILLFFFFALTTTGMIHDLFMHNRGKRQVFAEMVHTFISYMLIPLCYSIYTCQPIFFYSFFLFGTGYEIVRISGGYLIAWENTQWKEK